MPTRTLALVTLVGVASLACGGGGGDDSQPPDASRVAALAGSWLGFERERTLGDLLPYRLEIDARGLITMIESDGVVLAETGVLTAAGPQAFTVLLGSAVRGHFWTDAAGRHAVLVLEDWRRAILEKEATSLSPPYTESDVLGHSFSGPAVSINADFEVDAVLPSTLVTAVDGTFGGTVGTTPYVNTSTEPVALLHVVNGERGAYLGVYVDPGGEDGIFNVWLSPDKTFVFGKGRSREAPSALEHNVYFLWTRDPP